MPPDPRELPRVFARPLGFWLECPACGWIHYVRAQRAKQIHRGWDSRASTLTCQQCKAVWIVGLAVWKVKNGPRRPALPRDQVPKRSHLGQLRERRREIGGGVFAGRVRTDSQTRPWVTNLVPECTCRYLDPPLQHVRERDPECPIHGEG